MSIKGILFNKVTLVSLIVLAAIGIYLAAKSDFSLFAQNQTCDEARAGELTGEIINVSRDNLTAEGRLTNNADDCSFKVGMASYRMFDNSVPGQELFDWEETNIGPNQTISLFVDLPQCAAQIDLFRGDVITSNEPWYDPEKLLDFEFVDRPNWCVKATPSPTPTVTPSPSPTPTITPTPVPTQTPVPTLTPTPTPVPTTSGELACIDLTPNVNQGHAPLTVAFDTAVRNTTGIDEDYLFIFGDNGNTVIDEDGEITHTYYQPGTYYPEVRLKLETDKDFRPLDVLCREEITVLVAPTPTPTPVPTRTPESIVINNVNTTNVLARSVDISTPTPTPAPVATRSPQPTTTPVVTPTPVVLAAADEGKVLPKTGIGAAVAAAPFVLGPIGFYLYKRYRYV